MRASSGIGLSLALLTLTGCAAKEGGKPSTGLAGWFTSAPAAQSLADRYEVTAKRIPLYFYGPAQPGGPDMGLTQGQKVTMLQREALFSHVRTEGGKTGYVATEYLKLLPPEPEPEFLPGLMPDYTADTFRLGSRRKLPELQVVPIDMMLEEPPLPVQGPPPDLSAPSDPSVDPIPADDSQAMTPDPSPSSLLLPPATTATPAATP